MYLHSYPSINVIPFYQCHSSGCNALKNSFSGKEFGNCNQHKLHSGSSQIGVKIDFLWFADCVSAFPKIGKFMLLAKENVAWSGLSVIPINCFINTSVPQNKHTNKQTTKFKNKVK